MLLKEKKVRLLSMIDYKRKQMHTFNMWIKWEVGSQNQFHLIPRCSRVD